MSALPSRKPPQLQVLVATMHQSTPDFLLEMNLCAPAVVINQTDHHGEQCPVVGGYKNCFHSTLDRGLSNSRNLAISLASADVCIIADDDVRYESDASQTVLKAFRDYPGAHIIVFRVDQFGSTMRSKSFGKKPRRIGYMGALRVSSCQISFDRRALGVANLRFDARFGAGADYPSGEESILLFDALRKGLKIVYVPHKIAETDVSDSTWFKGYDTDYFVSKGAAFERMSSAFSLLLVVQFVIRKRRLYSTDISLLRALRAMLRGRRTIRRSRGWNAS